MGPVLFWLFYIKIKNIYSKTKAKYKEKNKLSNNGSDPLEFRALVPSEHWNHGCYVTAERYF